MCVSQLLLLQKQTEFNAIKYWTNTFIKKENIIFGLKFTVNFFNRMDSHGIKHFFQTHTDFDFDQWKLFCNNQWNTNYCPAALLCCDIKYPEINHNNLKNCDICTFEQNAANVICEICNHPSKFCLRYNLLLVLIYVFYICIDSK